MHEVEEGNCAPALSIVTVCFDDLEGLQRTHRSLPDRSSALQHEWIVQDGGSSDGTGEWLASLDDDRLRFDSRSDRGIFDAMNRATARSAGQYLLYLNSGDELTQDGRAWLEELPSWDADILFGDAIEADVNWEIPRPARRVRWLPRGMFTHHQAMFFRRRALPEPPYRERFRLSGDYDLVARLVTSGASTRYIGRTVARFELGGRSQSGRMRAIREDSRIRKEILGLRQSRVVGLAVAHGVHAGLKRVSPTAIRALRSRFP